MHIKHIKVFGTVLTGLLSIMVPVKSMEDLSYAMLELKVSPKGQVSVPAQGVSVGPLSSPGLSVAGDVVPPAPAPSASSIASAALPANIEKPLISKEFLDSAYSGFQSAKYPLMIAGGVTVAVFMAYIIHKYNLLPKLTAVTVAGLGTFGTYITMNRLALNGTLTALAQASAKTTQWMSHPILPQNSILNPTIAGLSTAGMVGVGLYKFVFYKMTQPAVPPAAAPQQHYHYFKWFTG